MNRAYWIDKVSKTDVKDENLLLIYRKIMKNSNYGMENGKDYLFDVPTILNNYETFERITGITLIDDEDYEPDPPLVRIEQFLLRSLNDHEKAAFHEKINEYTNRYLKMNIILDEFSPELWDAFDDYKTDANYHSYDSYPFDEKERIFHEFLECLDD